MEALLNASFPNFQKLSKFKKCEGVIFKIVTEANPGDIGIVAEKESSSALIMLVRIETSANRIFFFCMCDNLAAICAASPDERFTAFCTDNFDLIMITKVYNKEKFSADGSTSVRFITFITLVNKNE